MTKENYKIGYVYIIRDDNWGCEGKEEIAIYWGRTEEFECCVCGKGHNAHRFDLPYNNEVNQLKEALEDYENDRFENPCYGKEHLPTLIKCLGKYEDLRKEIK